MVFGIDCYLVTWVRVHLKMFLLVPSGSKSTPSGRVSSVEKKERRVSTEENDKPQKPREYVPRTHPQFSFVSNRSELIEIHTDSSHIETHFLYLNHPQSVKKYESLMPCGLEGSCRCFESVLSVGFNFFEQWILIFFLQSQHGHPCV